tara:strand:- start:335 stop:955 length:621 start_codon:yes stop_codon:yes gene_type:complete
MTPNNQLDLFDNKNHTSPLKQKLEIEYIRDCFNKNESDALFDSLRKNIEWKQDFIKMFGKSHPIPRLTAWYGDEKKTYTYSGITMLPLPWTKELIEVKSKIEVYSKIIFNSVLLNFYRSGSDSVSWHSDDEKELGEEPIIGSISFGGIRRFRLRNKKDKKQIHTYELKHGSLLLMKGKTQKYWEHEIPKTKKKVSGRINLTFRFII